MTDLRRTASVIGDATWSVSTGLGACMAAGVYEVGRPRRVTAEEAADIDTRWRDFGAHGRSPSLVGVILALPCTSHDGSCDVIWDVWSHTSVQGLLDSDLTPPRGTVPSG